MKHSRRSNKRTREDARTAVLAEARGRLVERMALLPLLAHAVNREERHDGCDVCDAIDYILKTEGEAP